MTDARAPVKKTTEAVLDSRVLLAASDAGALKARQLKIDTNAFDVDDFFQKLARFMGGRVNKANRLNVNQSPLKWERAGRVLGAQSRRIPGINLMCVFTLHRLEQESGLTGRRQVRTSGCRSQGTEKVSTKGDSKV